MPRGDTVKDGHVAMARDAGVADGDGGATCPALSMSRSVASSDPLSIRRTYDGPVGCSAPRGAAETGRPRRARGKPRPWVEATFVSSCWGPRIATRTEATRMASSVAGKFGLGRRLVIWHGCWVGGLSWRHQSLRKTRCKTSPSTILHKIMQPPTRRW